MSDDEWTCTRCKRTGGRRVMTSEEFKTRFKVGDIIIGWSTNKRIRITAIGEMRFLFVDEDPVYSRKERAASFYSTMWAKAERAKK